MDLARIRKKARAGQSVPSESGLTGPSARMGAVLPRRSGDVLPSASGEQPYDLRREALASGEICPQDPYQPRRGKRELSPLEIILAGREAADCNEGPQPVSALQARTADVAGFEEFLSVRIADETYGIDIMQIKEIIKPRQVTEVPHAPSFVCGVISLRGVIIPVLDMTRRLGLKREAPSGKEHVVVAKIAAGLIGLLVDQVVQFVRIAKGGLEAAPTFPEGIDRNFISAVGCSGNRMILLLNLDRIAEIQLQ